MEIATGKAEGAVGTYYMPVAGPFSVHGVHDFVGCWGGVFFSIETKAPSNPDDETTNQGYFRTAITKCGGIAITGVRSASPALDVIQDFVTARAKKLDELEVRLGREPI